MIDGSEFSTVPLVSGVTFRIRACRLLYGRRGRLGVNLGVLRFVGTNVVAAAERMVCGVGDDCI